jgi:hypothetical protein
MTPPCERRAGSDAGVIVLSGSIASPVVARRDKEVCRPLSQPPVPPIVPGYAKHSDAGALLHAERPGACRGWSSEEIFFPGAPMNRSKPRSLVLAAVATLLALPAVAAIGTDEGAGIPAASHARAQGAADTPEQRERQLFQDSDVSLRVGCNRVTARSDRAGASRDARLCR